MGGGGGKNSPVAHITSLSQALKKHNTRLIYVSLPLKLSIYPELVANDSCFLKGASTLPQFRQMTLELLENNVEVIDMSPIFMQNKNGLDSHLFAKGHHISYAGANLTARTIADYIKSTTNFNGDDTFIAKETTNPNKTTIYKDEKPYIVGKEDSPFCIFGNCNLQAFHEEGAGIAANTAFYLNQKIDYLGRKLIFWGAGQESFDKETFNELCKRDIAICVSFLSGSFVRTSITTDTNKINTIRRMLLRKKKFITGWSSMDLH